MQWENQWPNQDTSSPSCTHSIMTPGEMWIPNLRKYNGTTCPVAHLQYLHAEMSRYYSPMSFTTRAFQESLTGPALQWFITADIYLTRDWNEMSSAFLLQYQSQIGTELPCENLVHFRIRLMEDFRAYARRWKAFMMQTYP